MQLPFFQDREQVMNSKEYFDLSLAIERFRDGLVSLRPPEGIPY